MLSLDQHRPQFEGVVQHFKHELTTLRVGNASPSSVEELSVFAYNTETPLKQLASITTSDVRTLVVQPWDKSVIREIEKAIFAANLGLTPVVDGQVIRLIMPPLTEERRREMVKQAGQKLEQAKQSLRQVRDALRDKITAEEKNKELSEDEKFRLFKEVDKLSSATSETLQKMADEKSKQVMTI